MAVRDGGLLRFLPFVVLAVAITFIVFSVAVLPKPWYLLIAVGIAVFLAIGYWTWGRTWRDASAERRDRQRRWGIRTHVDPDDPVRAPRE